MSEPLVIVGNGMAAARLADELSRRALGRYAVAIIGEEPDHAYNRVLLSPLLGGEISEGELALKPQRFWADKGVTLKIACRAERIDRAEKRVHLSDGRVLPYSKLVLATGSVPVRPSLPGIDKAGVVAFRDKGDVAAMQAFAKAGGAAVVIGGGLLGIEAAVGLARLGAQVTLVHRSAVLMERQLDARAGALLTEALAMRGVSVELAAVSEAVIGDGRVEGLRLVDGRVLPCGLLVVAAGVAPRVDLARQAGLTVQRGVVVDDGLATSDPDIYAIGECAEHNGHCYGLVEPAYEQASVLAARLSGGHAAYHGSVLATNLKVSGVPVFSCGETVAADGAEELIAEDGSRAIYRKLIVREDRLVGAVLFGETREALWYRDLIRSGEALGARRVQVMFGRSYAEAA